jgi:hypothetical protein
MLTASAEGHSTWLLPDRWRPKASRGEGSWRVQTHVLTWPLSEGLSLFVLDQNRSRSSMSPLRLTVISLACLRRISSVLALVSGSTWAATPAWRCHTQPMHSAAWG